MTRGAGSAPGVERLMANKTKATPQKEEAREKGPETPDAPLPLLDLGITNGRVFAAPCPDDPNDVVILQDVADVSKART
jgi:hypothetical protein